ncbi:collagen alpha-1(I) chain-like [Motacilla alba alba]|uniref:collagen alpha-1(I) chain-like n=1 Tax=Motacilla alba alba TaxID=1094192 RepID=UPI0018D551DD|nr:collagen alpha-1(I) chain-like [Motacilla alba alba]
MLQTRGGAGGTPGHIHREPGRTGTPGGSAGAAGARSPRASQRGRGGARKRGRSSDVTGSPGPAPSPGRGRGHRGGFLAARWGRHGRRAGGPPPPPPRLSPPPSLRWDCPAAAAPAPAPAPRQGATSPPRLPGVSSRGGPRSARHEAAPPPTAEAAAAAARGAARCASRSPLAGPGPRGTGTAGRAHTHTHTHTRTDTQRDGADAEIPEVPPCRPPGRASPRPRPPGPPRPGAAGETHRRAAHPAAATTFHPGRQPAAAASPSAAGSGRGRKYEEEARRALRRGAPFLARDAGFAGGGCAAAVGFLHQLRGCVCTAHTCVCVCVRSP